MFCKREGRTPGGEAVNTPDCQHPKCQESKREGCRVAYKEYGRTWLGLRKTLAYILSISKVGLSWSLTKNQSCFKSLLRASAYGTSVSGTAWLLFTVLSCFNFFHHLYLLVYLFTPDIWFFFFQVHFLAWLLYLHHRAFAKKPRNWICAK